MSEKIVKSRGKEYVKEYNKMKYQRNKAKAGSVICEDCGRMVAATHLEGHKLSKYHTTVIEMVLKKVNEIKNI